MNTIEALTRAEALANQFRGFIRAAAAKHARFDVDDVSQNLAVIACETPDAFNVTSPKAELNLIRLAIPKGSRPEEWTGQGMKKACLAERLAAAPTSQRARIVTAMRAQFGPSGRAVPVEQFRKAVSKALRAVDPVAMTAPDAPALTYADSIQDGAAAARAEAFGRLALPCEIPARPRPAGRRAKAFVSRLPAHVAARRTARAAARARSR